MPIRSALALLLPDADRPVVPTHWSFGQLAGLVGARARPPAPASAPLAPINLQYGLACELGPPVETLRRNKAGQRLELRAVTGPDYGRIFDHELVGGVQRIAGNEAQVTQDGRFPACSTGRPAFITRASISPRIRRHSMHPTATYSCSSSMV